MAQLTPEQLKAIQDYFAKNPSAMQYQDPSGMRYAATYSGQRDENGQMTGPLVGYSAANGGWQPGQQAQGYDTQGNQTGSWTAENPYSDSMVEKLVKAGLIAGAGATAMGMGGTTGLFSGAGVGGAGGMSSAELGALDGMTSGGIGGGSAGLGGAGAGGFNAAMDSQLANVAIGDSALSGYTAAGAGGITASPLAASAPWYQSLLPGTSGGASSLLGGASGFLGPAATALGALSGAQGNKNATTSEHKMDPRLDGPVFGENGLVPRTQGLLAQQMSPEQQAGWMRMQQQGMGLLNQPVAGNGFGLFSGRK